MRPSVLVLGSIAIAAACLPSVESSPTSELRLSNASVVMTEDAILRIAGATCGREVGCGNVGSGRRFTDGAECTVATGRASDAEIGGSTCPSGVSEQSLVECLSEVRNLVCSIHLEVPGQLLTCRRSALCGVDVRG